MISSKCYVLEVNAVYSEYRHFYTESILRKANDSHCNELFKFVCTEAMCWLAKRGPCPREVELMHSNELHPGGKLSQDDVKTLLFTAIISLLRETFGAGAEGSRYVRKMQIQYKEMGFKLGPA
jgi:hypothetical protein